MVFRKLLAEQVHAMGLMGKPALVATTMVTLGECYALLKSSPIPNKDRFSSVCLNSGHFMTSTYGQKLIDLVAGHKPPSPNIPTSESLYCYLIGHLIFISEAFKYLALPPTETQNIETLITDIKATVPPESVEELDKLLDEVAEATNDLCMDAIYGTETKRGPNETLH